MSGYSLTVYTLDGISKGTFDADSDWRKGLDCGVYIVCNGKRVRKHVVTKK